MIHFFNNTKLAHKLKNDQVSSKEKLWYLIISTLIIYLGDLLDDGDTSGYIDWILSIADCIIVTITIYVCYRINSKGDGDKFIERFVCLTVPISIRGLVLIIILTLLLLSIVLLENKIPNLTTGLLVDPGVVVEATVIYIIANIYMFHLFIKSFRIISGADSQ